MSLCSMCLGLDVAGALRQVYSASSEGMGIEGWYSQARDVFHSASTCQLCSMVYEGWKHSRSRSISQALSNKDFNPEEQPKDLYADIKDIEAYCEAQIQVRITRKTRFDDAGQKWGSFLIISCQPRSNSSWEVHDGLEAQCRVTHSADANDDLDIGVAVDEDSMSVSAVSTAKVWLENCLSKHQSCSSKVPTAALPSRYLDINDGVHDDKIFLRDGGAEIDHRYVALSHCWGTAHQLRTTSTTFQGHKQGIPIHRLPNTFKDAVQVVRALGLRYLWIDSLCIVQDDIEDWRKESGKMAEIYRNAHFVLAAARSDSDQKGFLGPRSRPVHVELAVAKGARLILELLSSSPSAPIHDTTPIDHEPLSRRAWCLQERYLARRALYYGSRQMLWECGQIRATEDGDFDSVGGDQLQRIRKTAAVKESVFNGLFSHHGFNYVDWYSMITEYTSRDITKDSDRLPALLGLVNAIEVETGDRYLIGLWLGGLLEGLMWCASTGHLLTRPRNHTAPSWSWVSVKGEVRFPMYHWYELRANWKGSKASFEPLAEYVSHTFEMHDDGPGQSIDGRLCLSATTVPIRRFKSRAETDPKSGSAFGIAPERSPVADRTFRFQYHDVDSGTRDFWIDGAFDVVEEEHASNTERLHIVFLTRLPFVLEFDFLEHRFGLIVERQGSTECYKRVGFVDGCLLDGGQPSPLSRLLPDCWKSDSSIVHAFSRESESGDMDSDNSHELNKLAPDPLRMDKQQVTLI
ncbi:heterokaryon incompatibility protein-domain-containing protein [Hypoxylon fuscum]|nr:heterokaryon incompatibility protein-domain-containing protein [Hypoxylon fuscum]